MKTVLKIILFESFKVISLFSYQGSLFLLQNLSAFFAISLIIISRRKSNVNTFFRFFYFFRHSLSSKRRRRDLNPRAAINDLHPFQGCPFGQLGYFSRNTLARINPAIVLCGRITLLSPTKRRGWDSNPCALADKRFSRPPRYDHFDTSPGI